MKSFLSLPRFFKKIGYKMEPLDGIIPSRSKERKGRFFRLINQHKGNFIKKGENPQIPEKFIFPLVIIFPNGHISL